jgi:fucose 4-O-acetylase-like acetyltransferase
MPDDKLPQAAVRDGFLDCLKGLAILTVVAGHTFQARPDFDDYWPFKFIYAFHMPMFMFVSGMTAAFFFERNVFRRPVTAQFNVSVFLHDLWKKAQRLLIPFLTWAAVSYALRPSGDFVSYMTEIIRFPDNGLWFLPVLFWCSIGLTLAGLLVVGCRRHCPDGWSISWDERRTQLAAFIAAAFLVSMASRCIPSGLGLYEARPLFFYVAAGLVYQIALSRGLPGILRPLPYVIFLALVPFWHRTNLSPLVAYVPSPLGRPHSINSIYVMIVAIAGTLAFVDLAGLIHRRSPAVLQRSLAFLGQRSLDVYAIHFHFLGTWPAIVAPTLYSLVVSTLLRLNSWTAWIFFGQRRSVLSRGARPADHSSVLSRQTRVEPAAR